MCAFQSHEAVAGSSCLKMQEMMDLWKDLAIQNGFPGLHIVQCLGHKDRGASKHVDALLEYQPNLKRGRLRLKFKDQR